MSQPFLPGTSIEKQNELRHAHREWMKKFYEEHGTCLNCRGLGTVSHWDCPDGFTCSACNGRGYATNEQNLRTKAARDKYFKRKDG